MLLGIQYSLTRAFDYKTITFYGTEFQLIHLAYVSYTYCPTTPLKRIKVV